MTARQHIRNISILTILALIGFIWYLFTPDKAELKIEAMQGAIPEVSKIRPEKFPTIQVADIAGWKKGEAPTPVDGLSVGRFAEGLDHPRWLYALPNGDVLVAESTQPERETGGIGDWITRKLIMSANGSTKPANRITLLRDADGDGVAELKTALLTGLNSPFGMALVGDRLFVANTDSVMAFPFKVGETKISAKGEKLFDLPSGTPNNHWTRNLAYNPKKGTLYVTIGSNSNIGENGMEGEKDRASDDEAANEREHDASFDLTYFSEASRRYSRRRADGCRPGNVPRRLRLR